MESLFIRHYCHMGLHSISSSSPSISDFQGGCGGIYQCRLKFYFLINTTGKKKIIYIYAVFCYRSVVFFFSWWVPVIAMLVAWCNCIMAFRAPRSRKGKLFLVFDTGTQLIIHLSQQLKVAIQIRMSYILYLYSLRDLKK